MFCTCTTRYLTNVLILMVNWKDSRLSITPMLDYVIVTIELTIANQTYVVLRCKITVDLQPRADVCKFIVMVERVGFFN